MQALIKAVLTTVNVAAFRMDEQMPIRYCSQPKAAAPHKC